MVRRPVRMGRSMRMGRRSPMGRRWSMGVMGRSKWRWTPARTMMRSPMRTATTTASRPHGPKAIASLESRMSTAPTLLKGLVALELGRHQLLRTIVLGVARLAQVVVVGAMVAKTHNGCRQTLVAGVATVNEGIVRWVFR